MHAQTMHTQEMEDIKTVIRETIRETVRETLKIEMMKARLSWLPEISDEEQRDIDERYGDEKDGSEIGSSEKIEV